MALGNKGYNNNNDGENVDRLSVFSSYSLANLESPANKTKLEFRMWAGSLIVAISPKIDSGDKIDFDRKNGGKVYLTHIKAKILLDSLVALQQGLVPTNSVAVDSGKNIIQIKKEGSRYDISIFPFDPETGKAIDGGFTYETRTNFHYNIQGYEPSTGSFEKEYIDEIDIEMLKTQLHTYFEAQSMAMAYSVVYQIDKQNNRPNYSGGNSVFKQQGRGGQQPSKPQQNSFTRSSIDDLYDDED